MTLDLGVTRVHCFSFSWAFLFSPFPPLSICLSLSLSLPCLCLTCTHYIRLSVYSATKFFVEALSQGIRLEVAGKGVKVTTVQPGDCHSELPACTTDEEARRDFAQSSKDRNVWLDPVDVAKTVVWAVTQPEHVGINEVLVEPRDAPA